MADFWTEMEEQAMRKAYSKSRANGAKSLTIYIILSNDCLVCAFFDQKKAQDFCNADNDYTIKTTQIY